MNKPPLTISQVAAMGGRASAARLTPEQRKARSEHAQRRVPLCCVVSGAVVRLGYRKVELASAEAALACVKEINQSLNNHRKV